MVLVAQSKQNTISPVYNNNDITNTDITDIVYIVD